MWIQSLREILYFYAQEYRHIGYRQGKGNKAKQNKDEEGDVYVFFIL